MSPLKPIQRNFWTWRDGPLEEILIITVFETYSPNFNKEIHIIYTCPTHLNTQYVGQTKEVAPGGLAVSALICYNLLTRHMDSIYVIRLTCPQCTWQK
jgi:hypothetical protein